MIIKLGRNDSCSCNSGKKYKKCCVEKNIPVNDFEGMIIINDTLSEKDFHDNRECLPEDTLTFMGVFLDFVHRQEEFTPWQVIDMFNSLEEIFKQYPNNPVAVGYLCTGYEILGDTKKQAFFLDILQKKFPRYAYGRIICAQAALKNNQVDEALHFLENAHSLKTLAAPKRILFHLKETIFFHMMLIECYIKKDNDEFIARHYKNLQHLMQTVKDAHENMHLITIIKDKIDTWSILKEISLLAKKGYKTRLHQRG